MFTFRKLIALLLAIFSTTAFAITDAQVFAWAEANYSEYFPGTPEVGQLEQYDYRYYQGSGNYLAVDTSGMIYVLGPISGNEIAAVGTVASFADTITQWEATQTATTSQTGATTQTGTAGGSSKTQIGGAIQGTALKLNASVTIFAGGGACCHRDGTGTSASFSQPGKITTDGINLYVAEDFSIRQISIATGKVSTLAGGTCCTGDGVGKAAKFFQPWGITTDGVNLYVTDIRYNNIRKIEIASATVTTLAGGGGTDDSFGTGYADGVGTAAAFHGPRGITTDGKNLYVADTGNHRIRKIEIATAKVTTLAGSGPINGSISVVNMDGFGTAASFDGPQGITTDGLNLYVADTASNRIRKIVLSTGEVTTLAGSLTGKTGKNDGVGTQATLWGPTEITSDGSNLYVSDHGNNTVRKIVISTGEVTTLAGSLTGKYGVVDGTGSAALLYGPEGITTDGVSLYEVDTGPGSSQHIRRIQ